MYTKSASFDSKILRNFVYIELLNVLMRYLAARSVTIFVNF